MDREEWRPRQSVGEKKDDGVARSSRFKEGSNAVRRRKSIGPVVVGDNGGEGWEERRKGGGEARNVNRSHCTMKQKQLRSKALLVNALGNQCARIIAFIVMQRCLIMCLNRRTRCTHVYRYVETFLLLPTQCKLFYTIWNRIVQLDKD